jgi:hypothetical protein
VCSSKENVCGNRYKGLRILDLGASWRRDQLHAPAVLSLQKEPPVSMWYIKVKVKVEVMLRLTVSQYVLVSSALWNLWPDNIFCRKVSVLSLWGALSGEKSGLSPVGHCYQCLVHCQRFNIINIVHVTCFMYMRYILDLCQHRLSTADHANNLRYNSSLDTWTVVRLTADKFKPHMFSASGFALPNIADIRIFMILYNFFLLPA